MRDAGLRKSVVNEFFPTACEFADEVAIGRPIRAKARNGFIERVVEQGGGTFSGRSVVKWMRQSNRRRNPLESVLVERQRAQKRRADCHWINGRADIMNETRQSEFLRSNAAPGSVSGFENADRASRLGEADGSGQSVGTGADNDRVTLV